MKDKTLSENNLLVSKDLIDTADFSNIINRLTIIERWSKQHAEEAVFQYRRFLFLNKKYGSEYILPPSVDIDHAWHAHVLYTEDYIEFCNDVFGEYLHHRPHKGYADSATTAEVHDYYKHNTQRLYHLEYGSYIYEVRSPVTSLWCNIKQAIYAARV